MWPVLHNSYQKQQQKTQINWQFQVHFAVMVSTADAFRPDGLHLVAWVDVTTPFLSDPVDILVQTLQQIDEQLVRVLLAAQCKAI